MSNNDNSFLSREEVERMTGYKQKSKQCAALDRRGIFYIPDKDGHPSITWHSLNNPLSARGAFVNGDSEPNFNAM